MDLRTKLAFALVAISLASLLALGAVAYSAVAELLQNASVRQLEAVAASQERDLRNVAAGWRDRVRLVTSRTQLRESLRRFAAGETGQSARIGRIIDDALEAAPALRGIALFTTDAKPVVVRGDVETDPPSLATPRSGDPPWVEQGVEAHARSGDLVITFLAPLELDGVTVGLGRFCLDAGALTAVVGDVAELGGTAETLVASRGPTGNLQIITPRRHRPGVIPAPWKPTRPRHDPVLAAVEQRDATWLHAIDDRGEAVWAVTRYVEEMAWGLVVKVDAAEATSEALALRETMIRMALSLSALAIVAGILLGIALARPITALAEVARRVEEGDLDARADARGEDEVARLARAFNEMTEQLVDANRELEKRVHAAEGHGRKRKG